VDSLKQDCKFALRAFTRNPGFTLTAVITLALGIGANTTIFSIINSLLLNPLPYRDADRIVFLWKQQPKLPFMLSTTSRDEADFLRKESRSIEDLALYSLKQFTLTADDTEPRRVQAGLVSYDVFPFLGVNPPLGRALRAEDSEPGAEPVVLLGHGLWQSQYGGASGVLDKKIDLDGTTYRVVGVMPRGFEFPPNTKDAWIPLPGRSDAARQPYTLFAVARYKAGVGLAQAQAEMDTLSPNLPVDESMKAWTIKLVTPAFMLGTQLPRALWLLFGAVSLVLLVACANVANLLLARATVRQREIAVRAAMGAGRRRLLQQLLTESVVLATLGGLLALLFVVWSTDLVTRFSPESLSELAKVRFDASTFSFAIAVSVLTGLLFGLAPALHASRLNLNQVLKQGGTAGGTRIGWLRRTLVVGEVALSVVLAVGAGLLIHSFHLLGRSDVGFRYENLLVAELGASGGAGAEAKTNFVRDLHERLRGLPGVERVSFSSGVPPRLGIMAGKLEIERRGGTDVFFNSLKAAATVQPGYFETLGIPILEGRSFTEADAHGEPVAIVNEAMARDYWPGESAIGRRLRMGSNWSHVVGVVGNTEAMGRGRSIGRHQIFLPEGEWIDRALILAVRTTGDPVALMPLLKSVVWQVDSRVPIISVNTADELLADAMARERFNTMMLTIFAGLALTLSAVGVYGLIAFSVRSRTKEIGIRIALGAHPAEIVRMVLGGGTLMLLAGLLLGVVAAGALSRLVAGLLYGITAFDPVTYAAVAAAVGLSGLTACFIPALRASRLDPIIALREE